MLFYIIIAEIIAISTLMYIYLHLKTRISKKYIFIDNVFVIILIIALSVLCLIFTPDYLWILALLVPFLVAGAGFTLTMIRFWRTPLRKITAKSGELVSPADGNIIYIKEVESEEVPVINKNGVIAKLDEITGTNVTQMPCWLIGINMTPFDVHKNCLPANGKIILNKHIKGEFLSLKNILAPAKNERHTVVIETDEKEKFVIVQTASKMVRRIDSYVNEGDYLKQGSWYGMIRFGSQVDLIIPRRYQINVNLKQQVYAGKTIIAKL